MPENEKSVVEGERSEEYEAAGSYQREIQQDAMGEAMGTKVPPAQRREDTLGEKESPDTTGTNPKRTQNSRPD